MAGLLVGLVLVGGLALRFIAPSPLWLDEALSVNIASLGFSDLIEALRHDGHPALFYLLLGWWMDLFGESDTAVRALSGLASLLTVAILYNLARRHQELRSGMGFAWVVLLLASSSPFLIRYATEARMYALLALFACATWLAVERAIERPSIPRLAAVAAGTAALLHTHYWSIWLVASALLIDLYCIVRGDSKHRPDSTHPPEAKRIGLAMLVGAVSFLPWLGVFLEQLRTTGTPWANRARPAEVIIETLQGIGGSSRFEGELLGLTIAVLAIMGVFANQRTRNGLTLSFSQTFNPRCWTCLLATMALGAGVAFAIGGAFEARYAAVVVGFILLLAARGIAMLPGRSMWSPQILVLGLVVALGLAVSVDELRRDRTQGGEVAALINESAQTGDVVVFCPDQLGPATLRSLSGELPTYAYPRGNGHTINWQNYLQTISETSVDGFAANVLAQQQRIWLVSNFGYKGFAGKCERLHSIFAQTHNATQALAPGNVYEPMTLTRFDPLP